MRVYSVTKYDTKLYGPHGYTRDEWMNFDNIGWDGHSPVLSFEEYYRVETAYAHAVKSFVNALGGVAIMTRDWDYRHEIETQQDIRGIKNPRRSFASLILSDDDALDDFTRLYLRGFWGSDLAIPGQGFIDFEDDLYMFFGFKDAFKPDWDAICGDVMFARDVSERLKPEDTFDACIAAANLTKVS